MLYLLAPLSDYRLVYSPLVEAEAQRHQKPGHVPVSVLRERWDWTLVPDGGEAGDLTDTDPKDLPVLASAIQAGAAFLVTGNVRHFGAHDLEAHGLSAVHPGLFLAHHTSAENYLEVLAAISAGRLREPRDPQSIHESEIAIQLPALFDSRRELFDNATLKLIHEPPGTVFRGPRCVRCTLLRMPATDGLCDTCRRSPAEPSAE